ncbi:MAG: hypothetical protein JRD04_01640 [Deltaproteobacteria bacterium]|nr:hypothetical protein [Deltaproteobacteria bacterium]
MKRLWVWFVALFLVMASLSTVLTQVTIGGGMSVSTTGQKLSRHLDTTYGWWVDGSYRLGIDVAHHVRALF